MIIYPDGAFFLSEVLFALNLFESHFIIENDNIATLDKRRIIKKAARRIGAWFELFCCCNIYTNFYTRSVASVPHTTRKYFKQTCLSVCKMDNWRDLTNIWKNNTTYRVIAACFKNQITKKPKSIKIRHFQERRNR